MLRARRRRMPYLLACMRARTGDVPLRPATFANAELRRTRKAGSRPRAAESRRHHECSAAYNRTA